MLFCMVAQNLDLQLLLSCFSAFIIQSTVLFSHWLKFSPITEPPPWFTDGRHTLIPISWHPVYILTTICESKFFYSSLLKTRYQLFSIHFLCDWYTTAFSPHFPSFLMRLQHTVDESTKGQMHLSCVRSLLDFWIFLKDMTLVYSSL